MSVTIYDIAREAKVGIGTVSRVFNNHPHVSEQTRKRVLAVSRRLKYRPHPVARALAGKNTNSVLAFLPFFPTHFFSEVLQGVQSKLSELDWELILCGVNHPEQLESLIERYVMHSHINGMLLFSIRINDVFSKYCRTLKTPLVLVDSFHDSFDSITVDNVRGAYLATRHLIQLEHKRIGLLNANTQSPPALERLKGYKEAMRDFNLPIQPGWMKESHSKELDGFTRESGVELMREFLALGRKRPTAVFVASDIQLIGALQALEESGLRCPDDVALVGYDDIELARLLGITTVRQPMFQMGALAVEIFQARLKDRESPPVHRRFLPELVVRNSSSSCRDETTLLTVASRMTV